MLSRQASIETVIPHSCLVGSTKPTEKPTKSLPSEVKYMFYDTDTIWVFLIAREVLPSESFRLVGEHVGLAGRLRPLAGRTYSVSESGRAVRQLLSVMQSESGDTEGYGRS